MSAKIHVRTAITFDEVEKAMLDSTEILEIMAGKEALVDRKERN